MRVHYRVHNRGRFTVYERTGALRFCCREMRDEWDILLGFGIKGNLLTTNHSVNIFTSHHMQVSGNFILGITEVRYCPWCGEEIEVVQKR